MLPHSPHQVTNPLPGYVVFNPCLFFFFLNNLCRVNNNVSPNKPSASGPLDYRKLPNPTKGFGDKAQRRITSLMTPKYETQSGSPLPRAESEYVVSTSVFNAAIVVFFFNTRL